MRAVCWRSEVSLWTALRAKHSRRVYVSLDSSSEDDPPSDSIHKEALEKELEAVQYAGCCSTRSLANWQAKDNMHMIPLERTSPTAVPACLPDAPT